MRKIEGRWGAVGAKHLQRRLSAMLGDQEANQPLRMREGARKRGIVLVRVAPWEVASVLRKAA